MINISTERCEIKLKTELICISQIPPHSTGSACAIRADVAEGSDPERRTGAANAVTAPEVPLPFDPLREGRRLKQLDLPEETSKPVTWQGDCARVWGCSTG